MALLGVAGYTLSESAAIEIAGIVVTVGSQIAIWWFRTSKADVSRFGLKHDPQA